MSDVERQEVTDEHRKLIFAFMSTLKNLKVEDNDVLDSISLMLGQSFDVDTAGVGGQFDSGIDLMAVFNKALKEKDDSFDKDEKFVAFLDLLSKKGYFKDCEEGSEEYNNRVQKAKVKFNQRNNPYEGLTADQIKQKGNEFMSQAKYKEAIAAYTKAIEVEPSNHIFYANRAAAHTHQKDYRSAIIDCEKSISINENYSKAYSRLGTALFYDQNYRRAVDAYAKAAQLEPDNEVYKADLKMAEEKLAASGQAAVPAGGMPGMPGMPPGMPGMPGMPGAPGQPDFSQMMSMMNNPQFMNMAQQMMQNPEFSGMVSQMAGQMGMNAPNPEQMEQFAKQMQNPGQPPQIDSDGCILTPFGRVNKQRLEEMQQERVRGNPKMEAIMADVKVQGMGAFQKHMNDPEVMALMQDFTAWMQEEAKRNGSANGGDGNPPPGIA